MVVGHVRRMSLARRRNVLQSASASGALASRVLSRVVNYARNKYTGRSNKKRKVGFAEAPSVSKYHENKVVYRKKRRRRSKFARKVSSIVRSVEFKNRPLKTMLRTFAVNQTWTPSSMSNSQAVAQCVSLNDYATTTSDGTRGDVYNIMTAEFANAQIGQGIQLWIVSQKIEFDLINQGSYATVIDLYYVKARKNTSTDNTAADTWYYAMLNQSKPLTGASTGTSMTANTWFGLTPFQCSEFCQLWMITKKRRILLNAGDSATVILKDNVPRRFRSDMIQEGIKSLRGVTEQVFFVAWCPSLPAGVTTYLNPGNIQLVGNKTLNYKIIDETELATACYK